MHNHQRHLEPNTISKLGVIVLSIILLTGISFIPVFQVGIYAQQPSQSQQQGVQQQNRVGLSQIIKQIAENVTIANPGTNATNVYQILVQLAKQTAQTSNQAEAIKEIRQISSQVGAYPFGTLSQVLSHFAKQVASGNSNVLQVVRQAIQEKASSSGSSNITRSLSNTAVQQASGGSMNVNQVIRHAAQILANRAGVPVEKVEAIIIQMALQIAQAQGRAITAQSIFQLANQIIQNPNGVLALAILQFVKQDDGGKTGATTTIIKQIVKTGDGNNGGGSGREKRDSSGSGGTPKIINVNIIIQNIVQNAIINAAKGAKVDVKQTAGQIVKASGNKISQITAEKFLERMLLGLSTKANLNSIPQTVNGLVAATTTDPTILDKIDDIAESPDVEDPTTSLAINDLTRDLANGKPANVALTETSIPDSASLAKDTGTTGGTTTTDGTTAGGGTTAFAGGTTTTDAGTVDGSEDTALDTGGTHTGEDDDDDSSKGGDISDSGDSDSGDSGDTSDSSGDSGDSGGGDDGNANADTDDGDGGDAAK